MTDEVIHSFLDSLLKRRNIKECYFWISEYYYSGFKRKTWSLLWKIFYDFYAIKYPKLEGIIHKEYLKWTPCKTINNILNTTLNLFKRTPIPDVFLLRISRPHNIRISQKPEPIWVKNFDPIYKNFIISLDAVCASSSHTGIMHFHMQNIPSDELYKVIRQYFEENHGKRLLPGALQDIPYKNKKHILLALITHLQRPSSEIILKKTHFITKLKDVTEIKQINRKVITPLYKTLPRTRRYSISQHIGCFHLNRFDKKYPPMKKLLGFHWEYFASFTPLWKKRFKQFKAHRNEKILEMEFQNDDFLEAFGEMFNFEPDEQSEEVQQKSIRSIPRQPPSCWLFDIFGAYNHRIEIFAPYH